MLSSGLLSENHRARPADARSVNIEGSDGKGFVDGVGGWEGGHRRALGDDEWKEFADIIKGVLFPFYFM